MIDGGHGDLDINFELSIDGRIIYVDYKKSDNIHRFEQLHPAGDYKFCFDNTISHFNRKTVFFELLIEDPDNPISDGNANFSSIIVLLLTFINLNVTFLGEASIGDLDGLSPEEFYEMKVQDILDIIHVVRSQMTKARQLQVNNFTATRIVTLQI